MLMIALVAALVQAAPQPLTASEALAHKLRDGTMMDLSNVRIDPTNPNIQCGQVVVNRAFQPIKFIVDLKAGMVWLEEAPLSAGVGDAVRLKVAGLLLGEQPPLESAWRGCEANGRLVGP